MMLSLLIDCVTIFSGRGTIQDSFGELFHVTAMRANQGDQRLRYGLSAMPMMPNVLALKDSPITLIRLLDETKVPLAATRTHDQARVMHQSTSKLFSLLASTHPNDQRHGAPPSRLRSTR